MESGWTRRGGGSSSASLVVGSSWTEEEEAERFLQVSMISAPVRRSHNTTHARVCQGLTNSDRLRNS